jgi:FkbM family methyltransferase
MKKPPRPALAIDKVRFVGNPVACVVAETAIAAKEAVAIDIEPLPTVTLASEAKKPGAPVLFDDVPNNVALDGHFSDAEKVEKAFAKAAHVTRLTGRRERAISTVPIMTAGHSDRIGAGWRHFHRRRRQGRAQRAAGENALIIRMSTPASVETISGISYGEAIMEFAQAEKSLFRRLNQIGAAPAVVYDIGASNGFWSAIVSDGLPPAEHHLFEPLWDHPSYGQHLQQNLKDHPLWKLHRVALAKVNGTATIRIDQNATSSTILDMGDMPWERREVDQYRLDDYVAKNGLRFPNAVKMDTQGSEHLILSGGKETIAKADILIVESWLYRGYGPSTPLLGEIIDIAASMGFFVLETGGHYQDEEGRMQSIDLFFAKPAIAKNLAQLSRGLN